MREDGHSFPDGISPLARCGRGCCLLTMGDVEPNPGPPDPPGGPPSVVPGPARGRVRAGPRDPYLPPVAAGRVANVDCVLGCARTWSSLGQLWKHVEKAHAVPDESNPVLLQWLHHNHKRICPVCRLLVPVRGYCSGCRGLPPECQPAPLAAFVEPATIDWGPVFLVPYRVVEFLPAECLPLWFGTLAGELALVTPTSDLSAAHRLFAFCRIMLQPPVRGGERVGTVGSSQRNFGRA